MGETNDKPFIIKDDGTIVRGGARQEGVVMDRYGLAFVLVPLLVDSYNESLQNGNVTNLNESLFCDTNFWKHIMNKLGFDETDFSWNEISFSQFQAGQMKIIVIEYPEPRKITHAKYGLIVLDGKAKYYTLEKTMVFSQNNSPQPGWIIGGESNQQHSNYGYYQGELSPKSFVLEILRKFYKVEPNDEKNIGQESPQKAEKEGCMSILIGIIAIVLITTVIGGVIGYFVDEHESLEMGLLFGCLFGIATVVCSLIGDFFNKK